MSRKKTILIAALINAGLLAVLMITALSEDSDENLLSPTSVVLEKEEVSLPEIKMQPEEVVSSDIVVPKQPIIEEKEEVVVHKIPEVEKTPKQSEMPKSQWIEITVKKGDNLEKLAKRYHTTIGEILALNHLPSSLIRTGQVLKVPKSDKKVSSIDEQDEEYYIVKPGDSPWTIAMKHHIKLEDLLKMNRLNNETAKKIRPGDRLKIR